jgi:hypothetical protein
MEDENQPDQAIESESEPEQELVETSKRASKRTRRLPDRYCNEQAEAVMAERARRKEKKQLKKANKEAALAKRQLDSNNSP